MDNVQKSKNGFCLDRRVVETLDIQGRETTQYLNLFQLTSHSSVCLKGMHVGENAYMKKMKVGEDALFEGMSVDGYMDLGDVIIGRDACFQNLTVSGYADWTRMRIGRDADFRNMKLYGVADLSSLQVGGNADFRGAYIERHISLQGLEVGGILSLEDATMQNCFVKQEEICIGGYTMNENTKLSDALRRALECYERVLPSA